MKVARLDEEKVVSGESFGLEKAEILGLSLENKLTPIR